VSARSTDSLHSASASSGLTRRSVQLTAPEAAQLIRDAIGAGGELWVGGSGQSMHPTVQHADQVLVAPLDRPVRRQDIVLLPYGPRLMLHRVVAVRGDTLYSRGDARRRDDPPARCVDVVARALAVRRGDQVTPLTLTTRFGLASLSRFLLREARRRIHRLRAGMKAKPGSAASS